MDKLNEKMEKSETVRTFWNEKWIKLKTPSPTKNCDYFISNYGKIKSVDKITSFEKQLKGSTIRGGYKQLNIRLAGAQCFSLYVHKFVAEHFVPKGNEEREFVIHLDENKSNNHWQNLKWMTRKELTEWQHSKGIFDPENKKRSSNTKMTETRVKMLKKWISEGKTKKKVLAKRFGISTMQLNRIERGENWGYVELDESGIENK